MWRRQCSLTHQPPANSTRDRVSAPCRCTSSASSAPQSHSARGHGNAARSSRGASSSRSKKCTLKYAGCKFRSRCFSCCRKFRKTKPETSDETTGSERTPKVRQSTSARRDVTNRSSYTGSIASSMRDRDAFGRPHDVNSLSSQTSVWTAALSASRVPRLDRFVYPNMPLRRLSDSGAACIFLHNQSSWRTQDFIFSDSDLSSLKSVSSVTRRIYQLQALELLQRQSLSHLSQESHSQHDSQPDSSDLSRQLPTPQLPAAGGDVALKRRHRKKRSAMMGRGLGTNTPSPTAASAHGVCLVEITKYM